MYRAFSLVFEDLNTIGILEVYFLIEYKNDHFDSNQTDLFYRFPARISIVIENQGRGYVPELFTNSILVELYILDWDPTRYHLF